jgi:membrane protein
LSLILSAGLAVVGKIVGHSLPPIGLVMRSANFLLLFTVVTLLFAMIFKILPDTFVAWGDVWIGSAVTSLLFMVGKVMIGLYLGRSKVPSAYGAAGSVIILLVWIYYSAQILLFGAEFTHLCATRRRAEPHLSRDAHE